MTPADLTYARGVLELSVRGLARALEVSPSTVSRWEASGEPIPRIAECAINWLLTTHYREPKREQKATN